MEDDEALSKEGIIRTIRSNGRYGWFSSSGMEYVLELNPNAVMRAFGQELNPESYAICKADMLIKGQDVSRIKLGNTLSNDQLSHDKFDYMLSNPPLGWTGKRLNKILKMNIKSKALMGVLVQACHVYRMVPLLFLMHLISKMRNRDQANDQGSRIGIILNGSPLFTGSAGRW